MSDRSNPNIAKIAGIVPAISSAGRLQIELPQPTDLVLLNSAARTATTTTAEQINTLFKGLLIFFDVSSVPGTDTVTLSLQSKDPASGLWRTVFASAAISGVTRPAGFMVYPGATAGSLTGAASAALPRSWRIQITHSAATSFTYSVAVCLLP